MTCECGELERCGWCHDKRPPISVRYDEPPVYVLRELSVWERVKHRLWWLAAWAVSVFE